MKQIKITYHKLPSGLGKSKTLVYDGVVFENGKVAFLDEDEVICTAEKESSVLDELNKHGKAIIAPKQDEIKGDGA